MDRVSRSAVICSYIVYQRPVDQAGLGLELSDGSTIGGLLYRCGACQCGLELAEGSWNWGEHGTSM